MTTPMPRHLLPPSLLQIADYCGEAVMWKVWSYYGGGHLFVPMRCGPDHQLSTLLGVSDAVKFCEVFGGDTLTIPKAESAKRAVRNGLIRQARLDGADNFTLCRRFGLTERQIVSICGQPQLPQVNLDLFDNPGETP
ncbi:MAG: Mor transcription activator family protein [Methylicorpusculum sp.]|uniref:Mor transcription activator family protein n=1 Tax=Methylicorpusculum sp. TaxID=2713644 RepID=UPI002731CCAF|nr:Mor transcription activator family protein [Methylicorpusculum sp.]MDP2202432.1 Mor transcription activator family protein [Methylicorpusculum sp.]